MPEPSSASAWEAADRAYQAHHFQCPQCIAAGITRSQERCDVGAPLWDAYQQAGDPPHFIWLREQRINNVATRNHVPRKAGLGEVRTSAPRDMVAVGQSRNSTTARGNRP